MDSDRFVVVWDGGEARFHSNDSVLLNIEKVFKKIAPDKDYVVYQVVGEVKYDINRS